MYAMCAVCRMCWCANVVFAARTDVLNFRVFAKSNASDRRSREPNEPLSKWQKRRLDDDTEGDQVLVHFANTKSQKIIKDNKNRNKSQNEFCRAIENASKWLVFD